MARDQVTSTAIMIQLRSMRTSNPRSLNSLILRPNISHLLTCISRPGAGAGAGAAGVFILGEIDGPWVRPAAPGIPAPPNPSGPWSTDGNAPRVERSLFPGPAGDRCGVGGPARS